MNILHDPIGEKPYPIRRQKVVIKFASGKERELVDDDRLDQLLLESDLPDGSIDIWVTSTNNIPTGAELNARVYGHETPLERDLDRVTDEMSPTNPEPEPKITVTHQKSPPDVPPAKYLLLLLLVRQHLTSSSATRYPTENS